MIGLEHFKKYFRGHETEFVIIGGAACEIMMQEDEIPFRTTRDLDIVLIVEALTPEFGQKMWQYIKEAGYKHRNKSTGQPQFYRFSNPDHSECPKMIELFSRKPEWILSDNDTQIVPLSIEDEISSLSAILLNDDYYNFLRRGQVVVDGLPVLKTEYLIPFKAKAWLDLNERKLLGEHVDSSDIKKHKNDVFRLSQLLRSDSSLYLENGILHDMKHFIDEMKTKDMNVRELGIQSRTKDEILALLCKCYSIDE